MICPECGEECNAKEEDIGYGYTECHGVPHTDIRLIVISVCCEARITDTDDINDYVNGQNADREDAYDKRNDY